MRNRALRHTPNFRRSLPRSAAKCFCTCRIEAEVIYGCSATDGRLSACWRNQSPRPSSRMLSNRKWPHVFPSFDAPALQTQKNS